MTDVTKGDLVRITFDRVKGMGEPMVQGHVIGVDDDPSSLNDFTLKIDEAGDNNHHIIYGEGTYEGEEYAAVSRGSPFSSATKIGENAELKVL